MTTTNLTTKAARRQSLIDQILDNGGGCDLTAKQLLRTPTVELEKMVAGLAPKQQEVALPRPKAIAAPKAPKGQPCECGCGEQTKGGRFRPGHDAKLHSAQKLAAGTLKHMPRSCKCGCGEMTKGGYFRPGHDARYYHALASIAALTAETLVA